jgi:hypothetical protein
VVATAGQRARTIQSRLVPSGWSGKERLPDSSEVTRRRRRRAVAAGGVVLGATATGSAASAKVSGSAPSIASSASVFFADPTMNGQVQFALGSAAYGVAEVGEILSAVDRINARGASYQRFFDQFIALGTSLARQADDALGRGRRVTARERYLRSAEYYGQALFFVLGTNRPTRARERDVYGLMQGSWDRATQLFSPRFERLSIPYGGPVPLRAYLLTPDERSR